MEESLKKIEKTLTDLQASGGRLFIAVSGGIDSMVLAHVLWTSAQRLGFTEISILHVNYGLRGAESDGDQNLVDDFCRGLGVSFEVLDLRNVFKPKAGIQEWARDQRFAWMRSLMRPNQDLLATAHHRGDLVENVLFRLSRGTHSSLGGLKGMNGDLWRPFLGINRAEIQDYASGQKVPYRDDSSNAKIIYSRNRIRLNVIPELEKVSKGASQRIADTADDIDEILAYLDEQFSSLSTRTRLLWNEIESLPGSVGRRVIARFLRHKACEFDRDKLHLIQTALKEKRKTSVELTGNDRAELDDGVLLVSKKVSSPSRKLQYEGHLSLFDRVVVPPGGTVGISRDGRISFLSNEGVNCLESVIKTT